MPEMDKLERFATTILKSATEEANAILEDIRKRREDYLSDAEDEILNESYRYIRSEAVRIRTETGRRISHKVLENKKQLYTFRDKLREEVLEDVRVKIRDFTRQPEYVERLKELLGRALKQLSTGERINVYMSEQDMRLVDDLKKSADNADIEFSASPEIKLGGLICECPKRRLRVDLSFESSLADVSERFAEIVGLGANKMDGSTKDISLDDVHSN